MTLLVTLLPLLNFLLLATASSFVNWRQLIALVLVSKSLVLGWSVVTFEKMILGETRVTKIGEWFDFGLLNVSWTFSIDPLTHVMIFTVMLVSTLVHTYSIAYMSEDPHLPRFLSYLSLFTFFMLVLISADNFVNLFLGWEGVGLCSYLLISFWYTRLQANKAAIKAMIVNRIADMALTLGMLTVFYTFQTTEFNVVFGLAPYISEDTRILFFGKEVLSITLCTALLFIGAMGKSAQLGLHTWLPDAMEGPSPVSALIHAATMVTAGVFLLVRCSVLFELAPSVLQYVAIIGAATAIMAATSGLFQNDLKKVIAYSTCSQLGFMVFACGVSQYSLSLFHLVNHAFFKALLFLGAGAVIHAVSNEQDTRKFGALSRLLPYTYVMFLIGSLALMGFPFLTGFYSKDVILEVTASGQTVTSLYAYNLGAITAFFTSFYSLRLLKLTFYGVSRSPRAYLLHTHELVEDMAYPLAVLALGSLFFGYFARDLFIGFGSSYWTGVITDATSAITAHREGEFLPLATKLVPLYAMLLALLVLLADDRITLPHYLLRTETQLIKFYRFLSSKWGFDAVYNEFLALKTLTFAYNNFALMDKGLLEAIGPAGLGQVTHRVGLTLAKAQTGRVYDYAYFMLLGLYAGLILMDFVVDPTGVGYLVESTEVLTSTGSQTRLFTTLLPQVHVNQLKVSLWNFSVTRQQLRIFIPTVSSNMLASLTILTSFFTWFKQSAATTQGTKIGYSLSAVISRWLFSTNHKDIGSTTIQSKHVLRLHRFAFILNVPPVAVPEGASEGFRLATETTSMTMNPVLFAVVGLAALAAAIWWGAVPAPAPITREMLVHSGEQLATLIEMIQGNPAGVSAELLRALIRRDETAEQVLAGLQSLAVHQPEVFGLLRADLREIVLYGIRMYKEALARAEAGAHIPPVSPWYFIVGFLLIALVCGFLVWWTWPTTTAATAALPVASSLPDTEQKHSLSADTSELTAVNTNLTSTTVPTTPSIEETIVSGGSE